MKVILSCIFAEKERERNYLISFSYYTIPGSLPLVLRPEAILCDHDDVVSAIAVADPWIGKGLASGSWDGTVKVKT